MEKRTVVEKNIVHSTPSGRILSETKMRTIYYEDRCNDKSWKISLPSHASCDSFSDSVSTERNCKKHSHPTITTSRPTSSQRVSLQLRQCAPAVNSPHYHHRTSDDNFSSKTEYVGAVDIYQPMETKLYGDEWSTDDSEFRGTRLVRNDRTLTPTNADLTHSDSQRLKHYINQINYKRKQYHKKPLEQDIALSKNAQQWASVLVINNEFKYRPETSMNLWMGSKPNDSIVDIWDEEMEDWPTHYFKDETLTKVGLARAYDDAKHGFVIVAEYA